jgi:hypothetical protein
MAIRKSLNQTRKALQERFDKSGQYWLERYPARLGNYSGVVNVPNKQGMVYARLETSGQVVEAINYLAPGIFDMPVFIGRDKSQPSVLKVSEIRWIYALGTMINYIVFHHEQHEYPNADTVWVRRDQFMPLLVLPAGGFNVRLFGDVIYQFGMTNPVRVEDADLDLSAYAVSAGAQYVLLEVLTDGTLNYKVSNLFGSRAVLELQPLPTPSENAFPICAFEFFEGQTELRRDSEERTIIDLRMFTSDTSSGTGSQINEADADTPTDGDLFGFWDVMDLALKNITWANIKATLKTYFDTLYSALGHTHALTIFSDAEGDPADVTTGAAADGTSDYAARRDHVHHYEQLNTGHLHGLARWNGASGQTTFELPDIWEYVDSVMLNGLEEDPIVYSLSSDGTQIVLDSALASSTNVIAHGVVRSL